MHFSLRRLRNGPDTDAIDIVAWKLCIAIGNGVFTWPRIGVSDLGTLFIDIFNWHVAARLI